MPGCSPLQVIPISDKVAALVPQAIEKAELRSLPPISRAPAIRGHARKPASPKPADLAARDSAAAWRTRYLEWMETDLPRASTRLLARLPLGDAVKLAALVGAGRLTWAEINAALDAMIKLAAVDALDGGGDEHDASPEKNSTGRVSEDEIWARYHAQCDEVFARDGSPTNTGASSREQLWRTEQILDRLRSIRDRDLAALRRRLGSQPSQTPALRVELSAPESAALRKLDAIGFVPSEGMRTAIEGLASEVASSAVGLNAACAAVPACRP
jgi:hypothetical protein